MSAKEDIRVLITGGSGFIGTNAMEFSLSRGAVVANIDIRQPRDSAHRKYWMDVDIRRRSDLMRAVKDFSPTHVWHLAAMTGMDIDNIDYFLANTEGVRNIVDSALHAPRIRRMLFTSSLLVCKNGYIPETDVDYCPPNLYGESKMIGEQLVRSGSLDVEWAIVRPTSIWGPWFEQAYETFFRMVDKGFYVHPSSTPIVKPLSYVGNTVFMMSRILFSESSEVSGQTYYLADYPENSIQDWANSIQRNLGARKIPNLPLPLMRAMATTGDILKRMGWKNPPLTSFRLNNMLTGGHYPTEKIQCIAGPLPYSMPDGVRLTLQWMSEMGKLRHAVVSQ